MSQLSHIDQRNQPSMVDVSNKINSKRTAVAQCIVNLGSDLMGLLNEGEIISKKGAVFQTAIIAGTMAAKKTPDIIPLCHSIPLENCKIVINSEKNNCVSITCTCTTTARTGVEMEALTGAYGAALTIYDMCKAVNPGILILETKLLKKRAANTTTTAHHERTIANGW